MSHTTRGCDGRQEGCESGYYHLHRYLNNTIRLHKLHLTSDIFHRLVLSQAAAGLGEHLAHNLTRLSVLDGYSLHGGCSAQGECLTVHCALCRRHTAVCGVVNLSTVRTTHAHLGRVGELRVTANGGRSQ